MMATYLDERWVGEQIESILAQEGVDVTLRICDDQSPDGTLEVCQSYAKRYPNVIVTSTGSVKYLSQMSSDPLCRQGLLAAS